MNKLLILVGPTSVGKTAISLMLAERFGGEIISADSRLFYRGMDIGTAKPSPAEMHQVTHHLVNICNPDQTLTLGEYQRLAYSIIDRTIVKRRLPLLVGGTGQYVMAVAEGWGIPEVAPRPDIRNQLTKLGGQEMGRWLINLDPIAAKKIDFRNERRVIRALEVTLITGYPISELQKKSAPGYDICWIGLYRDRETLYKRIDQRVDQMIMDGLEEEVRSLRNEGFSQNLPSMSGLGYRQINAYIDGELSFEEAVERIKFETHRFARQQSTWFRQDDPLINWFELEKFDEFKRICDFAQQWLAK